MLYVVSSVDVILQVVEQEGSVRIDLSATNLGNATVEDASKLCKEMTTEVHGLSKELLGALIALTIPKETADKTVAGMRAEERAEEHAELSAMQSKIDRQELLTRVFPGWKPCRKMYRSL